MVDVSAEILEAIEKNFEKFYQDPVVKRIYGKIYEGTATYTDSHTLASLVARYKREAIEKAYLEAEKTGELTEDVYGQIVKGTLDPELRDGRELVAEACGYVQKDLNHKSGIGLGVVDPGLNESRVDGLVKYVTEANEPKLSSTVVPGLIDTFCRSAVDEYLEANLDFQKESGLSPQISRTRGANSNPKCAFCAGLVYTGDYKGDGMPDEIFARHRYCHCNLLYMDGSGSVQDSWSKKEYASYQEAEKAQREYLTNLDKMTKEERWEVRKQKDREQRRARRQKLKEKRLSPGELMAQEYIDNWKTKNEIDVVGILDPNRTIGPTVNSLLDGTDKPKTNILNHLLGQQTIDFNQVVPLQSALTIDQIISKVGGGDMTNGSCTSAAFAYIANRNGLDVLDFRGGGSQMLFSAGGNISEIEKLVGGFSASEYNGFKSANMMLEKVLEGKEYIFSAGQHTAIIRKSGDVFEYLELQTETDNGFKPLTSDVLKKRFGVVKKKTVLGSKAKCNSYLADISKFKDNPEFEVLMGYINTAPDRQIKGVKGYAK